MAAETLARRGFAVTVLEKARKPGGQVITAADCLLKDKLGWCVEDLMTSVKKLGVKVKFGSDATRRR
jgi:NADPH-dependent 2,4-dienoyl-CoA reductase/sulfur reductase-like enzyme